MAYKMPRRKLEPKSILSDKSNTRLYNKGCNCKRSGCLKKYCECFEAKIVCSINCKCLGCHNRTDCSVHDTDPIDSIKLESMVKNNGSTNQLIIGATVSGSKERQISASMTRKCKVEKGGGFSGSAVGGSVDSGVGGGVAGDSVFDAAFAPAGGSTAGNRKQMTNICESLYSIPLSCLDASAVGGGGDAATIEVGDQSLNEVSAAKQGCNILTKDVVQATMRCMISQAEECVRNGLHEEQIERLIMEELGRCLIEIIDFSVQNNQPY